MIDTLFTLGYNKLEHISQAEVTEIAQIPGFTLENAERIIAAATEILNRPKVAPSKPLSAEEEARAALREKIKGVGPKIVETMWEAGYRSPEHVAYQDDTQAFADTIGVPAKKALQLWHSAKDYLERESGLTQENFEERKAAFLEEHGAIGPQTKASHEADGSEEGVEASQADAEPVTTPGAEEE